VYKHLIYAVPTFANPSSRIMSLVRREQLVRLARQYDALIVTDDVYDFLQWPASPSASPDSTSTCVPRIVDIDRFLDGGHDSESFGNAVSNGSFAKIIGPGVRTGWVEGTPKLAWGASQAGSSRSGGAPSQLTSTFLHQLLQSGSFSAHLHKTLIPSYASRYHKTLGAIQTHLFPLGVTIIKPSSEVAGGYFLWLTLPEGLDAQKIARRAKAEEDLIVAEGALFKVQGDEEGPGMGFERDMRICYAWEDEDKLAEGIERLARIIKSMLSGDTGSLNGGRTSVPRDVGSYQ
jgi:DNA-binding transcriptional MocR family regulator